MSGAALAREPAVANGAVRKVFVWENFGPGHDDRCAAVAHALGDPATVLGLELFSASSTYGWQNKSTDRFVKKTLFNGKVVEDIGVWRRTRAILRECLKVRHADIFFCHYEAPSTFLAAVALRTLGVKIYVMNDSKFDDYPRHLGKELVKAIFYMPYRGALSSGIRSRDYLRFLGVPEQRIEITYNTLSLDRIRGNAGIVDRVPPPTGDLEFTVVARLVEKKNLFVTLEAFALYAEAAESPRRLNIAGGGPLEAALKAHADKLGIGALVTWHGFVQTEQISQLLRRTLALVLLSTEEQFGNVIIEAQAMSLPCIVSTAVGARDHLIRSGVNGFIVEPENARGAAFFMKLLDEDTDLQASMRQAVEESAWRGDVTEFSKAVIHVTGPRDARPANDASKNAR
jgi:glycosyltransferase involved in cell wall biosynthesis